MRLTHHKGVRLWPVVGALIALSLAIWIVTLPKGLLIAGLLLGLAWIWFFRFVWEWRRDRRLLAESVVQLKDTVDRWASGDLWARVYLDQEDPLDSLAHGMNRVAEVLMERTRDLEQDKQQLEAILTSMANGIIILNPGLTVTLINQAAKEMFRIPDSDVVGRHLLEVIRDVRIDDAVHEVTRSHGTRTVNWSPPDNENLMIEVTVAPLAHQMGGLGVVMVCRDVSAQRQVDRMRQDFVANVSHELQTPLTIIRGFTETLMDDIDSESRERFIRLIHDEANRMSRLVDDLLTLSRMDHHTLPVAVTGVDIPILVESIFAKLGPRAREGQLSLVNQLPTPMPLVAGDADLLAEVFLNLVQNAIQYTPAGGQVTISGHAHVSHQMVAVWVEDTGIGIPAQDLPRIFERFYRVDKARSRASGGTGLGLAIVKHIIELHHGRIEVKSTVGQGTRFTLWLPEFQTGQEKGS